MVEYEPNGPDKYGSKYDKDEWLKAK